jgi:hypothetical protein
MIPTQATILLPDYPQGTVTYKVFGNLQPNVVPVVATYYMLPAYPQPAYRYNELPTIMTPSANLSVSLRVAGLGRGSVQMSADFDDLSPEDLGFEWA